MTDSLAESLTTFFDWIVLITCLRNQCGCRIALMQRIGLHCLQTNAHAFLFISQFAFVFIHRFKEIHNSNNNNPYVCTISLSAYIQKRTFLMDSLIIPNRLINPYVCTLSLSEYIQKRTFLMGSLENCSTTKPLPNQLKILKSSLC